ncbi:MAG: hypothetical protein R3A78_03550 [Polyangiales bacterium]
MDVGRHRAGTGNLETVVLICLAAAAATHCCASAKDSSAPSPATPPTPARTPRRTERRPISSRPFPRKRPPPTPFD